MTRILRAVWLVGVLLAAGQALHSQQIPPLEAADALGAAIFAHTASTGLVLVVVRDRDVHLQSFGQTAPSSGQRPDPNSLLRLCSITKILTTDLMVKLAQVPYPQQLPITLDAPPRP